MARGKGMGNLQLEKSGRWTVRVCVNGKRYSRSTGMRDREAAERFLNRMLAPMGLGEKVLPMAEVWRAYEVSPNRRELAPSTLNAKRLVWMHFVRWIEEHHLEITKLGFLTQAAVAEYLAELRVGHCGSTYNGRVCILREICHVVAEKGGLVEDPWEGVCLRNDDSHSRREFTMDELQRVLAAARDEGDEWHRLFCVGIYTGLRLGDCCLLDWKEVNLERGIIQILPRKTRKHLHGHPVTIPIHKALKMVLDAAVAECSCSSDGSVASPLLSGSVLPLIAEWYLKEHSRISGGLTRIFKRANITTSVKIEGRCTRTPDATFHSLRHTFVSLSANAGVPLPVVQSIVGHCSTAMTRHYYHENEDALRKAVDAIPDIGKVCRAKGDSAGLNVAQASSVASRLSELKDILDRALITKEEYVEQRRRILAEI